MTSQTRFLDEIDADLAAGRRELLRLLGDRCAAQSQHVRGQLRAQIDAQAAELRRLEALRRLARRAAPDDTVTM